MFSWWEKLRRTREEPFQSGASTGRRKTYSADSGYVYQYHLLGFRHTRLGGEPALEYAFAYSVANRADVHASVFLRQQVLLSWTAAHSRELSASERYALANMALKASFDLYPSPEAFPAEIHPSLEEIEAIAAVLDL